MKKVFGIVIVCVVLLGLNSVANAASLSAIYDFRDQLDATKTSFEGLDFTDDGTLWITSAPNSDANSVFAMNLADEEILSNTATADAVFNPVALASDGTQLFIGNNAKAVSFWGMTFDGVDPIFTGTVGDPEDGVTVSDSAAFSLIATACLEPEGAAYLDGFLYFSCQDSNEVIKVDPATGAVVERYDVGVTVLGVGATEDQLILGDYTNHALLLYDAASGAITETISLDTLFVGANSDYERLTGGSYKVDVENAGTDIRQIPDPDGIAYRNGKIYMTFEHDLRVYEISLGNPPVATPEPGTLMLLGLGLLGLTAKLRKKDA